MRVLHVSPHPDDELLGSPAVLIALAEAGHRIVNFAVSLGRQADRVHREAELGEACARVGFELLVSSPPYSIGRRDDLAGARARLAHELVRLGVTERFDVIVGPSPHDAHHGHEVVGRAAVAAAVALKIPLWMWGLWADLPLPTIVHPFGQQVLDRITDALSAHASQLARNDFRRMVAGRAQSTAVLGPERVFGFGSGGISAPYAEVLCEAVPVGGCMLLGTTRTLDPDKPLAPPTTRDLSGWLGEGSLRDRLGR